MNTFSAYLLRRIRTLVSLGLVGLFLLHAAQYLPIPFLTGVENVLYDYRLLATMPRGVDRRVVIVDIDERSLQTEGHWPWGRDRLARLVDALFDRYHIGLLGFDIVFAEYDDRSGLGVLEGLAAGPLADQPAFAERLAELRPRLDRDHLFAESLRNRDVILGYVLHDDTGINRLPPPVGELDATTGQLPLVRQRGYTANLPELQEAAYGAGFFNNPAPMVDSDGVFRRLPLLCRVGDGLYESLALAMVRAVYGQPPIDLQVADPNNLALGVEALQVGDLRIPVDRRGGALIPYRGPFRSFPYISATDVLNGNADPALLEGVAVLLGTTAPGLMDMRATPVQNVFPGVEVHANMIAGLLDQNIRSTPGYALAADLLGLLLLGVVMTLLFPRVGPVWGMALGMALFGLAALVNLYFWQYHKLALPLAPQLVLVSLLFVFHTSYGFLVEARGKRRLGALFGQYVPPEIVNEMSNRGGSFGIDGESREMTVLFSDVRSFTTISEGLKPDELKALMNAYFNHMTGAIHQNRGTIDKYIGDAIMAFWGAPLPDADHPLHALQAGMAMLARLDQVRTEFKARGWPEIHIGVGINTGIMNVGNMGSEFRMAYTVMGDAVNLGSRLEGLTKAYGVEIIVSEFTQAKVKGYLFRELDRVRVKGKDLPVRLFEPIGPEESVAPPDRERLHRYQAALERYRAQEWDAAEALLRELEAEEPGRKVYHLYLDRLAVLRENPPGEGWDAVFTFTTK